MEQSKLDRINFLARKSKEMSLSPEEREEQKKLRAEYIREYRNNLRGILENTVIQYPDGKKVPLKKK